MWNFLNWYSWHGVSVIICSHLSMSDNGCNWFGEGSVNVIWWISLFIRLVTVKNMMFASMSWLVKSKSHVSLQLWGWSLASGRCNINFVIRKNYLLLGSAQVTCCFQSGFAIVLMRAAPLVILYVLSAFLQIHKLCKSKNQMVWQIVDQACRWSCLSHWFPEHQCTYSMTCWSKWDGVLSFRTACDLLSQNLVQMCVGSSFWNCYLLWLMKLTLVLMNHQTGANNLLMTTAHKLPANWWSCPHSTCKSIISDLVGTLLEWAVTVGTGHALLWDFIWGMLVVVNWHGGTTY